MAEVLVVGSLHYDIVVEAPHLPRRDETVMGNDVRFICGGKGGNQAVAASRHGCAVAFAGAVGTDFFADALLENLRGAGVDVNNVARASHTASGMSVAIVEETGDYGAVVASGANLLIEPDNVRVPNETKYLLLQNEVPEVVNLAVARHAQKKGAQVILNAAPMRRIPDELLDCVDILIVNRVEAAELFGEPVDTPEQASVLLKNFSSPVDTIVVTLGADGLVFKSGADTPRLIPAFDTAIVSSHGAGDAFVGALGAKLAAGDRLVEALNYASAAAAVYVGTDVDQRNQLGSESVADFLRDRS